MRNLTIVLLILFVSATNAQEKKENKFLKEIFKYSTFYAAYSQTNAIQDNQTFYVDQDNTLHETTQKNPADFMMTYGWRKLANFQYEDRNRFYIGDENNASTKSNIGNYKGLEYLFQYSKGRQQGNKFENQEAFIRYLAKWWLIKGEYKKNELVDLNYKSAEVRARFPIGKKLSLNLGFAYRTYEKAYGYNPIEVYLQDSNWWNLSNSVGHVDVLYQMINPNTGQSMGYDWQWFDADGTLLANSDLDYRNNVFQDVVNNYNEEQLSMIGGFADLSAVAGLDFYHYRDKFWLHIYGSILPIHKLMSGDERYSYDNVAGEDFIDFSTGAVVGLKITKNIGLYGEINLQRYWDREIRSIKAGINIKI
jgi:hypothetical protein